MYLLTDSSDTVGIVRLFVIEVVHAEPAENKIESRYWSMIHLSYLGTSTMAESNVKHIFIHDNE